MSVEQELKRIIDRAALDGALTEQAVKQFAELTDEVVGLRKRQESSEREIAQLRRDKGAWEAECRKTQDELALWAGREQDLINREWDCAKKEVQAECAEQRVEDHREMFRLVFRNLETRSSVFTPLPGVPGVHDNGYQREYRTEPAVVKNDQTERQE